MDKQFFESLQTAEKSKANIVVIRNTAANGDDYYIPSYVNTVIVYNTGSYTQAVYLPPIAETVGQMLYIAFPDAGGTNAIADLDDSLTPPWSDLVPDADNDEVVLYNTGKGWAVILNGIA